MAQRIVAGVDGSGASRDGVLWAAHEADLRGATLELVHAEDGAMFAPYGVPPPEPRMPGTDELLTDAEDTVARECPRLQTRLRRFDGIAAPTALASAADGAALLVLGSRRPGTVTGFVLGSTGLETIPQTETPVILVRSAEGGASSGQRDGPVVTGIDPARDCAELLEFAYGQADRWGRGLVIVHGWSLPPLRSFGPTFEGETGAEVAAEVGSSVQRVLAPWNRKFPHLPVEVRAAEGDPAYGLLNAARDAALVVVGRRVRRSPLGIHIGPLAHAVIHHAQAPVAVVAHR